MCLWPNIIVAFNNVVGREGFEPPKTKGQQIYSLSVLTTYLPTRFYAEREGFEPPDPLRPSVFKTDAIDRSAISPYNLKLQLSNFTSVKRHLLLELRFLSGTNGIRTRTAHSYGGIVPLFKYNPKPSSSPILEPNSCTF